MKAKKFIDKKIEGEYEIIKNYVIEATDIENEFDRICEKLNLLDEDGDVAYFDYGLCFDMDGELFSIDVSKFIKGIENRLNDGEIEDYFDREEIEPIEVFLEKLKKYEGYDIYI